MARSDIIVDGTVHALPKEVCSHSEVGLRESKVARFGVIMMYYFYDFLLKSARYYQEPVTSVSLIIVPVKHTITKMKEPSLAHCAWSCVDGKL